jgi:hypothetical protein
VSINTEDIQTATNLLNRCIEMVIEFGRLPEEVVTRQINTLVPREDYPLITVVQCAGVGELRVNAACVQHVVFCTNGEVWAKDASGVHHVITYDVIPDAEDLIDTHLRKLGLVQDEELVTEWPEEDYIEMPAVAEEVMANIAPVFEQEGLPGVFVRSRTPESKRQPGQHLHAYQVMGQGKALSCTCPAARHGRKCWHIDAVIMADAWEKAARDLYDVLSRRGTASPEVKARAIARTWETILERTPRTIRGAKLDINEAMRRFIAFSSMAVTKIHHNKYAAQREFTL